MKIKLSNGGYALIDDEDYELVRKYRWCVAGRGYAIGNKGSETFVKMHHLIIKPIQGLEIDHINRNKLDNRKSNLRLVTRSINVLNGPIRSTNNSGVKGVCFSARENKWRAYAVMDGKQLNLGYYQDFNDAVKARRRFESEIGVT